MAERAKSEMTRSEPAGLQAWRGTIESLGQDGVGIGTQVSTIDGKQVKRPVFIPYTAPGDEVEARIVAQKGKYLFGEITDFKKPSPHRVCAPCPHFGVCGGCDLEHIAYDEQLRQKARIIEHLLVKKGVALPEAEPIVVRAAKEQHRYRWRARIAVRFIAGKVLAGFRKAHSREIVPIGECFIVVPEILAFIRILNAASYDGISEEFEITAVKGEKGKLGLHIVLDDVQDPRSVRRFFDMLFGVHRPLFANLFFEERRRLKVAGQVQEHLTYVAQGLALSFLPDSFIQANIPTNDILIETVVEAACADGASGVALDLYAGVGNFSLPLAKRFGALVAVEGSKRSAELGALNAAKNGAANILFLHRSIEEHLREYAKAKKGKEGKEYRRAGVVVIDPPRTGCSEQVIEGLLHSGIERIVYVSCDPATLARDLALLAKKYRVAHLVGVDMFPDISHVETVVRLERTE